MDYRSLINSCLLISVLISHFLPSEAESSGSVVFIDGSSHKYIRNYQADVTSESKSLSVDEVGAAVSVLIGSAPASSLSSESSSKLNEVLLPSLFDRPHAVFVLEVEGLEGPFLVKNGASSCKLVGTGTAQINLQGRNDAFVVNLDDRLSADSDGISFGHELDNLVRFSGELIGSFPSIVGNLTIILSDGTSMDLNLEKEADKQLALGLVALNKRIKEVIEMHDAGIRENPAVLIIGRFKGIQLWKEVYGMSDKYLKGVQLLQESLSKLLDSLQRSYGGKFVGVILPKKDTRLDSKPLFEVKFPSPVPRRLEDIRSPDPAAIIAETVLVRRILAWITGIILVISTLIGIHFLFNMPLTRDTLLYSNVKLD